MSIPQIVETIDAAADRDVPSGTSRSEGRRFGFLVYLARNEFYLGYTKDRAPGIVFTDVKDRHATRE